MPVMIWGNGACSANSRLHQGVIAIVSGTPNNGGGTMAEQITKGTIWAISNAGKGTYAHMDTSRVSAAGMSCGSIEAYAEARKEDEEDEGRLWIACGIYD
ncbi:hypothetical protein PG990_005192 [Apiospora arundinis]